MAGFLKKPRRYGIAIAADRVVAVSESSNAELWTRELSVPPVFGAWPDLVDALAEFRVTLGGMPSVVSIALLPDLAQVRPIELPFMRKGELLPVLQRDASRFFLRARDEQVVAIRHLHRIRGRRAVLAAAAPRWLVELLASEFGDGTVRLQQIVPAHAAWAFAANAGTLPTPQRGWIGVQSGGILELLELRRDLVRHVRRVRASGDERIVNDITGCHPSRIGSLTKDEPADVVAARYAGRARSLTFAVPSVLAADLRRSWHNASSMLIAATTLMLASGLLRLVDVRRELDHVRTTRQELASDVDRAVRVRASVSGIDRLVGLLCELRDKTPRWSDAIITVATHLPLDAHLLRWNATGDSVTLEGASKAASGVLEQLRDAPGVKSLHASAPIRLETNVGASPTEYFSIVLRLDPVDERGKQP